MWLGWVGFEWEEGFGGANLVIKVDWRDSILWNEVVLQVPFLVQCTF